MNTQLLEELDSEMLAIRKLTLNLQEAINIFDYLTTKPEDNFEWEVLRTNIYFRNARDDKFDIIVMHLSHLYHHQENFNLKTFTNKFAPNGVFHPLNIPEATFKQWKQNLKQLQPVIETVHYLRCNYVAHKDRTQVYYSNLTKQTIKQLLDNVHSVLRDIHYIVFKNGYLANQPIGTPTENLKQLVKLLAAQKKIELTPLIEHAQQYGLDYFNC